MGIQGETKEVEEENKGNRRGVAGKSKGSSREVKFEVINSVLFLQL